MKYKFLTFAFALIFLIGLINNASAVQIFANQYLESDNVSTTNYYILQYDTTNYDDIDGKPYESYIQYSTYIQDWNNLNPTREALYCNFSVYYNQFRSVLLHAGNLTAPIKVLLFNTVLTGNLDNSQYFVRLNKGDSYFAYMTCTFLNAQSRPSTLEIPATVSIVTPTWECQACQYYNWLQDQIKIAKAQKLATYTTTNVGYMGKFFSIFYEIAIMGFWLLLIFILLLAVGLIFYGIFWVYKFIYKHTKI